MAAKGCSALAAALLRNLIAEVARRLGDTVGARFYDDGKLTQ